MHSEDQLSGLLLKIYGYVIVDAYGRGVKNGRYQIMRGHVFGIDALTIQGRYELFPEVIIQCATEEKMVDCFWLRE